MLKKRILALALSLTFVVSALPMSTLTAGAIAGDAPALGALEDGAKEMAYLDFSSDEMPNGITATDITIEDGMATVVDGEIRFDRDIVLAPMQNHTTIIAEAVVRFNSLPKHGIVFSMGTGASGYPHLVMGMHENRNIKCNSTSGPQDSLFTGEWLELKYVVSDEYTALYINGEEIAYSDTDFQDISAMDGDLLFGQHTVTNWPDPAFDGDVSEIRLSVTGAAGSVAQLTGATMYNGTATVDEEFKTVSVEMLKGATKSFKFTTAKGGKAALSADGNTITVTSADGTNKVNYAVEYNEVDSFAIENGAGASWDAAQINNATELISQSNFTNLDPNRTYKLTAKVAFDLSGVAEDASDDTLVLGHSPCVYNVVNGADKETGWNGGGSWSMGIYEYYLTGGIFTLGQIKAMTPDEDGYLRLETLVGPKTFKYDPTDMESLKIQARIEGLKNVNAMSYFSNEAGWTLGPITEEFAAPDGIVATFGGFELEVVSDAKSIASVTVNGLPAAIDAVNKTVKIELPIGTTSYKVEAELGEGVGLKIADDLKTITVTAIDGSEDVYKLLITVKQPPKPAVKNPTNGTAKVNGKTVLYKDGKKVAGTKVVTVKGKTYVVSKGYVATGKTRVVKVSKAKSYVVNKYGIVQKGKKNKLVKVGKKSYIVNKSGVIQKNNKKNKLVKIGSKKYVVNKAGVVYKNKTVKVGKVKYKVNKKGVATKRK